LSFGDLLVLLLFVLFVALPAISRSQQQRRGGGLPGTPPRAPGPRPGTPGRTAAPTAPRPTAGGPASGSGPMAFPPPQDDDLTRRLAEARERVRQAMERRGGAASTSRPTQLPADDPRVRARGPLVGGPPPGTILGSRERPRGTLVSGDRDDGLLGTPFPSDARAAAPERPPRPAARERPQRAVSEARAAVAARDLRAEAPRLEIERLDERSGRRAEPAVLLAFDTDSVREGLVWHQVLSAPRARRRLGGGPFPER